MKVLPVVLQRGGAVRQGLAPLLVIALIAASAEVPAAHPGQAHPQQPVEVRAGGTARVDLDGVLLSVSARDVDLRRLLHLISEKSNVPFDLGDGVGGTVSVEFAALDFEEGVARVLGVVPRGGFVTEFKQRSRVDGALNLERVAIARQAALPGAQFLPKENFLSINVMSVGEIAGREVLFVPWGDGVGEIPIITELADGRACRAGFDRLRVGEDGTFYFVGWAHQKLWVYSSSGELRKTIDLTVPRFHGDTFDVDREGNVFVLTRAGGGDGRITDEVRVLDRNLQDVVRTTVSVGSRTSGACVVAVNGFLVNECEGEMVVADFRYLLQHPDRSPRRPRRHRYSSRTRHFIADPLNPYETGIGRVLLEGVACFGVGTNAVSAPVPAEFAVGGGDITPLGFRSPVLHALVDISRAPQFRRDYAFALLDFERKEVSYLRIRERDRFVFEEDQMYDHDRHFDFGPAGEVYQLLTSPEGIHVYRYDIEALP